MGPLIMPLPTLPRRVDFPNGYGVRIEAALNAGPGKLMTLSQGGAYVATPMVLLPQAMVRLSVEVPELSRVVHVEAVVVWENRGPKRPSPLPDGYGVRFIKTPTAAAEVIRRLLAGELKPLPEDPNETQALSPSQIREAITPAGTEGTLPWTSHTAQSLGVAARAAETSPPGRPYELREAVLANEVPQSAGIYLLSYDRSMDAFVGRADDNLRESLKPYIGRYSYFHFEVVTSRKDRYERECELFHRLGGDRAQLDNQEHPIPPPGPQLKCPVCVN